MAVSLVETGKSEDEDKLKELEESDESEPDVDTAHSASEEGDLRVFLCEVEPAVDPCKGASEQNGELESVDEVSEDDGTAEEGEDLVHFLVGLGVDLGLVGGVTVGSGLAVSDLIVLHRISFKLLSDYYLTQIEIGA